MEKNQEVSTEHVLTHTFSQITYKMHLILKVGGILMENGADSDRIMRYIMRTAAYMGIPARNVQCHIMFTTIMLNIKDEERTYTEFQKSRKHRANMAIIAHMSRLIWRAMRDTYSLEHFEHELKKLEVRERCYNHLTTAIGSSFACGGSCVLFGGDLAAFFITAVCAFIGFKVRTFCDDNGFNPFASITIAAFACTLVACLSQMLNLSTTPMLPIAASALFMVPGVPIINAANELLNNYITTGITRYFETLLIVGSMAFGTAIALYVGAFNEFTSLKLSPGDIYLYHPLAAAISAGGFGMLFNVPRRVIWVIAVGGMITILFRNICMFDFGLSQAAGSFIGAAVVGLIALRAIHWFHVPNVVLTIPSAIPLVPGILLYRFLFTFLNITNVNTETLVRGIRNGIEGVTIIIAIAIGVAIPNIFLSRWIKKNKIEQEKRLLEMRFIDDKFDD